MAKLRLTIELDIHSLEELEPEVQSEIKENEKYKDRSFTHEDISENRGLYECGCIDGYEICHMLNDSDACESFFFLGNGRIVKKEFVNEEERECQN